MRIDSALVRDGVTPEQLRQLISRHQATQARYEKLRRYYRGEHAILDRRRASEASANNRIVANHAKYITDMTTAYLVGTPVTYSAADGLDIEPVKDCYFEQAIANLDAELERDASICGMALEMVYANAEAQPRSCLIPAEQAFVVYDDTAESNKLFGVYYHNRMELDGRKGKAEVIMLDGRNRYTYAGRDSSFSNLELVGTEPHYFGAVPMIEYRNNTERQGDFEQQISLIDAYNTMLSDRVNDKEQFVDAMLLLVSIDLDSDTARKLKEERILESLDKDGRAEYLSKALAEADVEVLRNALKEDIHRFSMVPDLSDEEFAGNLSGVAIKYKLLGFEQHIKNKERLFETGLKERFALYNGFLNVKRNMPIVPVHKIDVEFSRNLPANELELSQMIANLIWIASTETLLTRLPFVTDAKEEAQLAAAEAQEKSERRVLTSRKLMEYGEDAPDDE